MTEPEAKDYLDRARRLLKEARSVAAIELSEAAGRSAYLAAFHAAQAFIFDRTGKIAKTHTGVRSEFARLAKDDPGIDRAFPSFLARAYNLKTAADYAVGLEAAVTLDEAEEAIETATRFVACITTLLAGASPKNI